MNISRSCSYSCINNCLMECLIFVLFKENLALKKPTNQQYTYYGSELEASNAVDGLKSNLSYSGGQCMFSGGGQNATLWVNLTSILSIHHITIYHMTLNAPWGMHLIINIVCEIISEQLKVHFDIDAF